MGAIIGGYNKPIGVLLSVHFPISLVSTPFNFHIADFASERKSKILLKITDFSSPEI